MYYCLIFPSDETLMSFQCPQGPASQSIQSPTSLGGWTSFILFSKVFVLITVLITDFLQSPLQD